MRGLSTKANGDNVNWAEKKFQEVWDQVHTFDLLTSSQQHGLFGRFCSRVILYLVRKQNKGREANVYKTLQEIETDYCLEHAKRVEHRVTGAAQSSASSAVASAKVGGASAGTATFAEVGDKKYVATKAGFKVGIVCKDGTGQRWELTEMQSEGVLLKSVELVFDEGEDVPTKTVAYEKLQSSMHMYKGELPIKLDAEAVYNRTSIFNTKMAVQTDVADAWKAMAQKFAEDHLIYSVRPSVVRTTTEVKKGELKLHVATDAMVKIVTSSPSTCVAISRGGKYPLTFYVLPPRLIGTRGIEDVSTWPDVAFIPFWWVTEAKSSKEANMRLSSTTVDGWKIPYYTNTRNLAKHEQLTCPPKDKTSKADDEPELAAKAPAPAAPKGAPVALAKAASTVARIAADSLAKSAQPKAARKSTAKASAGGPAPKKSRQ